MSQREEGGGRLGRMDHHQQQHSAERRGGKKVGGVHNSNVTPSSSSCYGCGCGQHSHHSRWGGRQEPRNKRRRQSSSIAWMYLHMVSYIILALLCGLQTTDAMRITRPWTTEPWCESVKSPRWPFAYSKYTNQSLESKGRVNSNRQDMRHECTWWGVQSKCHRCESIQCQGQGSTCHYQIQGVDWHGLSTNIPTLNDAPWAVNGSHRHDYGSAYTTHVCLMMSAGHCLSPYAWDYSNCSVRCWGSGFQGSDASPHWILEDASDVINGSNPLATDAWDYPKGYSQLGTTSLGAPVYNPQGYAVTLAGGNGAGYKDGPSSVAQFKNPQGVAVDMNGHVFVADTDNHRIRCIFPNGTVITVAGSGVAGHQDGVGTQAQFSSPSSLAVYHDTFYDALAVFVADTENHRIRRIDNPLSIGQATVSCFSGQCGQGTVSFTESLGPAPPGPGYADGEGVVARFDTPKGVAVDLDGWLYVADTNNHLIRSISPNGTTFTVAGNLEVAETDAEGRPLPGCAPPCLKGVPGHRDGSLTYAQFYYPSDVAVGLNNTVVLTDQHRVRMVTLPDVVSTVAGVTSAGRVVTLAGQRHEGIRDGKGQEAEFDTPEAITMSLSDGIMYVVDSVTCRVRRISPAQAVAETVDCAARFTDVIRPAGCQSYDSPVDARDKATSPVFGNIQYNDLYRNVTSIYDGLDPIGRTIPDCVGVPPVDRLDKRTWNQTGNLVIDDGRVEVKESTGDGTTIRVNCIAGCLPSSPSNADVRGFEFYSDDSLICQAAIHAGVITNAGGMVLVTLQRGILSRNMTAGAANLRNGIQTGQVLYNHPRVVTLSPYLQSTMEVQTISGYATAQLEASCGMSDGQPAQEVRYSMPSGISLWINGSLNDSTHRLYVADTRNHRVVALSAVCAFPCENMGRCIGPDICACQSGWNGVDCSRPICSSSCGPRQVCVGPDTCGCIPGYSNYPSCDTPLCIQQCQHGVCSAPDTCSCLPGWFDSNCTTPVCTQTCGNGGNCTAPDTCSCPSDWSGSDCRTPTCQQTCMNGGWCTAPNTCTCPPQWSGHDCSLPVCMQGFMVPDPSRALGGQPRSPRSWPTYVSCRAEAWCNATNGFDCRQKNRRSVPLEIPSGPACRNITGRVKRSPQCTYIELGKDAISPYLYVQADNSTTTYARYTPLTPYNWDATPKWPWSAFNQSTQGKTEPWTWYQDRQVALVEWRNITQGAYICANGGNCTAPDVCECAPGWMGFDCRTPVCTQGYYDPAQTDFVSGPKATTELVKFSKFMGNNSHRLNWPYSNPNYTTMREAFVNASYVRTFLSNDGNVAYLGQSGLGGQQGGYQCSLRAWTQYENPSHLWGHPNFWSRYMDPKTELDGLNYTGWWDDMGWPAIHFKSAKLRLKDQNAVWFSYTDEGYRKDGIWSLSGFPWTKGTCILEFQRVCPDDLDHVKAVDLNTGVYGVLVQDTDLSYRPRMTYDRWKAMGAGRWFEQGGECVDHVIRGCYNNGTCVAPNTCQCAPGWSGSDCSIPLCSQRCHHSGVCTLPDICTCEKGWTGLDCTIAVCAQECNNGGICIAPDTCKCLQWPTAFEDGRAFGGHPSFRKPNGDPQMTGWTGYDCSTPICIQAQAFILNVPTGNNNTVQLGGHGASGSLQCSTVRCPAYDVMVTENDGKSFQTGCGWDPLDTGCCYASTASGVTTYTCSICALSYRHAATHNFTCSPGGQTWTTYTGLTSMPSTFLFNDAPKLCGRVHNPNQYYSHGSDPLFWSHNYRSNYTSDRFLCNRYAWTQGDWIDNAGLGPIVGVGSDYGLEAGRNVRVNFNNITRINQDTWLSAAVTRGEGIFECYNGGSCIAPDICTCKDGWDGFDCQTPTCRHRHNDGIISSCANGAICVDKDYCQCIQTPSFLSTLHPHLPRGYTGWSGMDCSMPMCIQGFYDPFCSDLPQSPGNEGCYRCANGGNCTAPDVCTCAEGWTGFDCKTPVCEAVADELTRKQLATEDEEKIVAFEANPCTMKGVYVPEVDEDGVSWYRGNCTAPNQCACRCKRKYQSQICSKLKESCQGPWQDPLFRKRNVLKSPSSAFGTRDCAEGYEGNQDAMDRWTSCHLTIYVPPWYIRYTRKFIAYSVLAGFFALIAYECIRRRLRRKYLLAKIERRRSRRSSEESVKKRNTNAFRNR